MPTNSGLFDSTAARLIFEATTTSGPREGVASIAVEMEVASEFNHHAASTAAACEVSIHGTVTGLTGVRAFNATGRTAAWNASLRLAKSPDDACRLLNAHSCQDQLYLPGTVVSPICSGNVFSPAEDLADAAALQPSTFPSVSLTVWTRHRSHESSLVRAACTRRNSANHARPHFSERRFLLQFWLSLLPKPVPAVLRPNRSRTVVSAVESIASKQQEAPVMQHAASCRMRHSADVARAEAASFRLRRTERLFGCCDTPQRLLHPLEPSEQGAEVASHTIPCVFHRNGSDWLVNSPVAPARSSACRQ